ncbi:hypothetical protein T4C_7557 [Trichinella pseudospiralis]|uniref:Uncharacterized protein n=1 Tax=Trichinella pseudospiralis TaxID=6337 RepID=A0A0V1J382_TRIPS|nr:hypothetical protein T4C_7557 [Trichinella pseudospiralis]
MFFFLKLNVVNEVRNSKRKSKTDDKLQIIICRSAAMLSVLLEVDDASLHPLILCDSFALVVENEMANTCLFPMEYILNLKLDIKKKVFYGDCIVFMKLMMISR